MSRMWLKAANCGKKGDCPSKTKGQSPFFPGRAAHLLIMALALANGGCLAAAIGGVAAAGGVAGYAYYKGGLAKDFNASVDNSWVAAKTSLQELQLPVVAEKRTDNGGYIESRTGDGQNVRISFETLPVKIPAEGPRTDISVRAGVFGDRPLSERILSQIAGHLAPVAPLASAPPPGGLVPVTAETAPPPLGAPQTKP